MPKDKELLGKAIELLRKAKESGGHVEIETFKNLFTKQAAGPDLPATLSRCLCGSSPYLMAMDRADDTELGYWILYCVNCGRARVEAFDLSYTPYSRMGQGLGMMLSKLLQRWIQDEVHQEYEDQRALSNAYKNGWHQAIQRLSDLLLNNFDSEQFNQKIVWAISELLGQKGE